jgi:hypothetical protein
MELKTATALAIFGSILITLVQLFYTINSFVNGYNTGIFGIQFPSYILSIMYLLGCIFILIFFGTLYANQNREEE